VSRSPDQRLRFRADTASRRPSSRRRWPKAIKGGRLPGQGRPGADQQADGDRDPHDPGHLRDDGVRPDRRNAGGAVSDPDRYTSLSLPYHIGNGWFGGFLPATSFAIVAPPATSTTGLWYPIIVAGMTFVIVRVPAGNKDREHLRGRLTPVAQL